MAGINFIAIFLRSYLCRQLMLLIIPGATAAVRGSVLYVTPQGQNTSDCRTLSQSCRTLGRAVGLSGPDDVIHISSADPGLVDPFCHEEPILLRHSLAFRGEGSSLTHLGCASTENRAVYVVMSGREGNEIEIKLTGLRMTEMIFNLSEVRVVVEDVQLVNVKWSCENATQYVGVMGHGLRITGTGVDDTMGLWVNRHIDFILSNFTISNKNVILASGSVTLNLDDGVINNAPGIPYSHNGLWVMARNGTRKHTTLNITRCRFEGIYSQDSVIAVQNLNFGAFRVQTEWPNNGIINPNVSVVISDSEFINNERGVALMGSYSQILIERTLFRDNVAMHAGAGLVMYINPASVVAQVVNSTFINNQAGSYRPEVIKDDQEFTVTENEVNINSSCCKGVISLVGKGGAIRVQRGNASLIGCVFSGNHARLLGAALFVDRDGNLTIENTYGETFVDEQRHPMEGEFFYSNGIIIMRSAQFKAHSALNHVSIVSHSGAMWSMEVQNVVIICPVGYMLRATNTSTYLILKNGLVKSYKLDHLAYFCESCPRNKYSLDYGYLNYSLQYQQDSYFTLKVDSQKPVTPYKGTYVHQNITCQPCPYGGKCHHELTAVENFWGYVIKDQGTVRFQLCPKGYCCSRSNCRGFNSCQDHRNGTLCGKCEPGYSEAMFNPECVHNSYCDPLVGYPVMISSGILYFIFLLFQKDVRDLMFSQIVKLSKAKPQESIRKKMRKKSSTTPASDTEGVGEKVVAFETEKADDIWQRQSQAVEGAPVYLSLQDSCPSPPKYLGLTHDGTWRGQLDKHGSNGLNGDQIEVVPMEDLNGAAGAEKSLSLSEKSKSNAPRSPVPSSKAPKPDVGVSFLIIIFFYFQDAQLLHIKTAFASAEKRYKVFLKDILTGLFQFRVEFFQFMNKFCFLEDMTALKKVMIKVAMVPCVLMQFGVVYLIYRCCLKVRRSKKETNSLHGKPSKPPAATFSVKLATGMMLALLFTYQQLAASSFVLLNCVSIDQRSVLFIQGTEWCYQSWQYGVMAYAGSCIVPFCLVLLIGPGLLEESRIGLAEFFVACIIPPPFLLRWIFIKIRQYGQQTPALQPTISPETKLVTQILQGPFKEQRNKYMGKICGQGYLIGRRLVLVLLYTFVNDALLRMLFMMILCFIILLHHVHALPYKDSRGNMAGSVSAACLLILGAINLVRAAFEAAEYVPHGPNSNLMWVLDEVENCLTLWFPGFVMAFVICTLLIKVALICVEKICAQPETRGEPDIVASRLANQGPSTIRSTSLSVPPPSGSSEEELNKDGLMPDAIMFPIDIM